MNPEDMPKNVWRWLQSHPTPFLFVLAPGVVADYLFFDDDPEAVEAVVKAYRDFERKRFEKKMKKKQTLTKESE